MRSIVSYPTRGIGGNNMYRGNCSPLLISDLIDQFKMKNLNDYMCGSNTTKDVAISKNIESHTYDLHSGFNLLKDSIEERCENIFWHPPYYDIVLYSDVMYSAKEVQEKYGYNPNEYDLSRSKSYSDFVKKLNYCCLKQFTSLEKGGRLCILVGDIKKKGKLYSMLLDLVKPGTIENIVIKAQHNCWSNNVQYTNNNFIPIEHEYLLILRKDNALFYEVKYSGETIQDIRDLNSSTWKDTIASVLENYNRPVSLSEIYFKIEGHKKASNNKFWKEKVRQTLNTYPKIFNKNQSGNWKLCY